MTTAFPWLSARDRAALWLQLRNGCAIPEDKAKRTCEKAVNRKDLKQALDNAGVNPDRYDLDGGTPNRSEGLSLVEENGRWLVRHFERGSWYTLDSHVSEADACDSFLRYASDPFYRT